MWVANQQGKVSSWSLIWSRLYEDQTKRRSGRGNHLDGKEKREGEGGGIPWWEKSQQNEVVWRLALWWQSQWKCKRLVVGGACCLGSKVHLLYLFPMVLVPMAHSSPMADITETCKWHQVRTQKDVELTWTCILDLWRQKSSDSVSITVDAICH